MDQITENDLKLINELSSRTYSANRLLSNATETEKANLKTIKIKLKKIADFFAQKYKDSYGPFDISVVTGNDIAIGGTNFKRIWSGIFKGGENKQYSAQISFVINPLEACLDVGFYFGRASAHSINKEQKIILEGQLKDLGISLSNTIKKNEQFKEKYNELFDLGFIAYSGEKRVSNDEWVESIKSRTSSSQIIAKIYPNDFHIVENSTIDSFVSQIIFLMGGISNQSIPPIIKPLTPEQRAKQAERLAEIGNKGELYIMGLEKKKLKKLGIKNIHYPKHVALESTAYGYDILSVNSKGKEIYIEVKTTTREKNDKNAKQFFISSNEYQVYKNNKIKYKLYRVYDIENSPSFEELDLGDIEKEADGYICTY